MFNFLREAYDTEQTAHLEINIGTFQTLFEESYSRILNILEIIIYLESQVCILNIILCALYNVRFFDHP